MNLDKNYGIYSITITSDMFCNLCEDDYDNNLRMQFYLTKGKKLFDAECITIPIIKSRALNYGEEFFDYCLKGQVLFEGEIHGKVKLFPVATIKPIEKRIICNKM